MALSSLCDKPFMEETVTALVWRPIKTAPADVDLELGVYDKGEYHAVVFPCRRDGLGWRDVRANRPMPLRPTHWRWWRHKQ